MKLKILLAGALLTLVAFGLHHSMRSGRRAGDAPRPTVSALPVAAAPLDEKELEELRRLEALVDGEEPRAAELLADSLTFLDPAQRHEILHGYWDRVVLGTSPGRRYEHVLFRWWHEVRPFAVRSIAEGDPVVALRALHVVESFPLDGRRLPRELVGALRSALLRDLGGEWTRQEASRPQRAAALRMICRFRLRSLEKDLRRLAREEVQLDLRRAARRAWEGLTGKRWPPEDEGTARAEVR